MSTSEYFNSKGILASPSNLPLHVAIIMDGNGRWAKAKSLPRSFGHQKGKEVARQIIRFAAKKGIKALTLFAFGVENWKRPKQEVRLLFSLFAQALSKEIYELHEHNICFRVIGDLSRLDPKLQSLIQEGQRLTQDNTQMVLNLAVNYSGRWDLLQAMQKTFNRVKERGSPSLNDLEKELEHHLSMQGLPEPDLFIRTGGVERISNFFLWELAYCELYFTQTPWPEFTESCFESVLDAFAQRERRFGLTSEQLEKDLSA